MKKETKKPDNKGKEYPGVTLDRADDEKVDSRLIKERTATLDDNPRDNQ